LNAGQSDLMLLRQWEKVFRADARADNYALFRNHLRKLELPEEPRLLLEGTIRMMRAIWVFANMDHQPLGQFLKMQQYDPSKSSDACYAFTFDLCGKAYARIMADSKLVLPDLADLYNYPWETYKAVGYTSVSISRPDFTRLTEKELDALETEVTDDLLFDYSEDEINIWFDPRTDNTYLFVIVEDVEEDDK
jgi:hypothetical protein